MPPPLIQWLLMCSLVTLCVVDSRTLRLPNRFTLPLWLLGIAWHGLSSQGLGWGWSLRGTVVATLPLLWFVLRGRMGAGDLKLMGAIGAWLGGWTALHVLAISGVSGAVLELLRRARRTPLASPPAESSPASPDDSLVFDCAPDSSRHRRWIPFSIPITIGVILMVLFPGWKYPAAPQRTTAAPVTQAGSP